MIRAEKTGPHAIHWEKIFNTINEGMILIQTDGTIFKTNR